MIPLLGVDISQYQWPHGIPIRMLAKLKRKGIVFIITRASIGMEIDTAFVTSIKRIRDAGLVPGGYHFLTDDHHGGVQADTFVNQIHRVGTRDILMVCDFEASATNHPEWQQVKDWNSRVSNDLPHTPIGLYSSRSNAVRVHNPDATNRFDYLWNAVWTDSENLDVPGMSLPGDAPKARYFGFRDAPLWQYGPCRITPPAGKRLNLDGDAFYGTRDDLLALTRPRAAPLPERPSYAAGHNLAIDAIIADIDAMPDGAHAPGVPATAAGPAGWDDGKSDARSAVDETRMT